MNNKLLICICILLGCFNIGVAFVEPFMASDIFNLLIGGYLLFKAHQEYKELR